MKQCKRDFWVSSPWGKVFFILAHWLVLLAGWKIFQPKIIKESGDIAELTINAIPLLLFAFSPTVVIFGIWLVSEKIQAEVTKQESRNEAEIKKLKLEICKIKCERELVESKDRCLKSQKENQQSAPEN